MNKNVIYVPEAFVDTASEISVAIAGGVTLSPGHIGIWKADDGEIIRDSITLVTVIENGTQARDTIIRHLFVCGEQAVAYESNGVPFLHSQAEHTDGHL